MVNQAEVGSVGWLYDSWDSSYYPDELPEEWKLAYFSNEFHCVLVPYLDWSNATRELLEQWQDDVHDRFKFFFEAPVSVSNEQLQVLLEIFQDMLAGIVLKLTEPEVLQLTASKNSLLTKLPLYACLAANVSPASFEKLKDTYTVKPCWRSEGHHVVNDAPLGLIDADGIQGDLRLLRSKIEDFLGQMQHGDEVYLLFEGSPPPVQIMRDAMVIFSLLIT